MFRDSLQGFFFMPDYLNIIDLDIVERRLNSLKNSCVCFTISNYTTKNSIGAVDTQIVYAGYGERQKLEVPKTEVSIDDLFSGDNYYGEQMKLGYEVWRELNPDQDFT